MRRSTSVLQHRHGAARLRAVDPGRVRSFAEVRNEDELTCRSLGRAARRPDPLGGASVGVAAADDRRQDAHMLENPFEGPKAQDVGPPSGRAGAWEGELSAGAIAAEAWALVRGTKGPILLGLLGLVIVYGLSSAVTQTLGLDGQAQLLEGDFVGGMSRSLLGSLLLIPLTAPATAVLSQLALTRARGGTPGFDDVRRVLDKAVPIIISTLLTTVGLIVTAMLGLGVGGVLFAVLSSSTLPLVLGYGLAPVDALTTSIKGTWSNFGVAILLGFYGVAAVVATLLTLGVFALWALPFFFLSVAVFTLRVFGPPTEPA